MPKCDLVVLCNINFSRPFLLKARQAHKLIATDVHTLATIDDDYNQDFMEAANILFMSDEHLPTSWQGGRGAGVQGRRVAGSQGGRVAGWQGGRGAKVAGAQSDKVAK